MKSSQRIGSGDLTGNFVPQFSSSDQKRPIADSDLYTTPVSTVKSNSEPNHHLHDDTHCLLSFSAVGGLPQQLSKLNNPTILPNNVILLPVDSAWSVGVIFW